MQTESSTKDDPPPVPENVKAFITAVEQARNAVKPTQTSREKEVVRAARTKAICSALAATTVNHWVGKVDEFRVEYDGKAVFSINVADDTYIGTERNAISDISDSTLLEADTPAFANARFQ